MAQGSNDNDENASDAFEGLKALRGERNAETKVWFNDAVISMGYVTRVIKSGEPEWTSEAGRAAMKKEIDSFGLGSLSGLATVEVTGHVFTSTSRVAATLPNFKREGFRNAQFREIQSSLQT